VNESRFCALKPSYLTLTLTHTLFIQFLTLNKKTIHPKTGYMAFKEMVGPLVLEPTTKGL